MEDFNRNSGKTTIIAGPCAVESEEQMERVCSCLSSLGVKYLRGGCFKPRTKVNTFRGLGGDGLKIMHSAGNRYGMKIVTEVRDTAHLDIVAEYADIVQIGAKSMYDNDLLLACGELKKPIIIKRNFAATVKDVTNAVDFILSGGNDEVIICERGIRTFESNTRFTLDLCGVAWLKEHTDFPIIVDPSHAMGFRYGVADLARAAVAMGVEGLMVEVHPQPEKALSDSAQQLDLKMFGELYESLKPIVSAVNRKIN